MTREAPFAEKLYRARLRRAMEAVEATPPMPGAPPEWDTPGGPARWVHDLRYTKSPRQQRIEAMQRDDWLWPDSASKGSAE